MQQHRESNREEYEGIARRAIEDAQDRLAIVRRTHGPLVRQMLIDEAGVKAHIAQAAASLAGLYVTIHGTLVPEPEPRDISFQLPQVPPGHDPFAESTGGRDE